MSPTWRGIMPIVLTPFTRSGALDEAALRRTVAFCLEAGATGLVGPANASEFTTLSDGERLRWVEIVVAESGGKVPVIASATCGHAAPAAALSRRAQELGVGGIMSMPPHILHPDADGCYDYFRDLAAAVDLPICVQNFNGPVGTPMSPELLARMCRELPGVDYIKEETFPEPRRVSLALAAAGSACKGVLGGQGGIYLLDEHNRGVAGNMPGCHTTDVLTDIWDRLESGDQAGARSRFNRLLPLMMLERLYGVAVYKEVLYRRGIIDTTTRRAPGGPLDQWDRTELDTVLADVETLYRL